MCARSTPSNCAPRRRIALRDRSLRASVFKRDPEHVPHVERVRQHQQLRLGVDRACAARCGASQVDPISTASGSGPALSHVQRSMFMNRVEPTHLAIGRPSGRERAPRCRHPGRRGPSRRSRSASSAPSGTQVRPNVERSPAAARASAGAWPRLERDERTCVPGRVSGSTSSACAEVRDGRCR